jgi:hypothetical protein
LRLVVLQHVCLPSDPQRLLFTNWPVGHGQDVLNFSMACPSTACSPTAQ